MSRDQYGGRGPQRWDTDRFNRENERYGEDRDPRRGSGFGPRAGERSVDEVYERRTSGPRGYEDDRVRERIVYDDDESRYRPRRESVTIEKEREVRRAPPRPGLLRRQSSLDTFDRKPFPRFEREEYGPPARREDFRPAYVPPPLPRYRALPPPRRYAERDIEEIKISEPDFYGDDEYRPYPERVREREIIRTRRPRSPSPESTVRSASTSSSSSEEVVIEKKFPKKGKTRMPARLVSLKAIIELGYPYEKEGDVIVIQKALGPENIDEVIKLSETFKNAESKFPRLPESEMSGGRSEAGTVVEERREEIIREGPERSRADFYEKTTYERRELSPPRSSINRSRSVGAPIIVDAPGPVEIIDRSRAGPLVLIGDRRVKDDRAIRAEIKALEAEREALKAEAKAQVELDRADRIRRGDLIIYEKKEEKEPDEGVIIRKDKKGAQARALATMLKTLT